MDKRLSTASAWFVDGLAFFLVFVLRLCQSPGLIDCLYFTFRGFLLSNAGVDVFLFFSSFFFVSFFRYVTVRFVVHTTLIIPSASSNQPVYSSSFFSHSPSSTIHTRPKYIPLPSSFLRLRFLFGSARVTVSYSLPSPLSSPSFPSPTILSEETLRILYTYSLVSALP